MFVDAMPLFNRGSYILIIFLRLIAENAVLSYIKMSFFHLNIEFCTNFFSEMKRLLSILFSVHERMVILDSYVNDSLSYIVAKRFHGEQHVKKIFSTVAIDKRGHALNPVRGYSFTGEDMNTCVP